MVLWSCTRSVYRASFGWGKPSALDTAMEMSGLVWAPIVCVCMCVCHGWRVCVFMCRDLFVFLCMWGFVWVGNHACACICVSVIYFPYGFHSKAMPIIFDSKSRIISKYTSPTYSQTECMFSWGVHVEKFNRLDYDTHGLLCRTCPFPF